MIYSTSCKTFYFFVNYSTSWDSVSWFLRHREKCKSDHYPLSSHTLLGQVHHLFLLAHALLIASSPHQLVSSAHFCSECDSERNVHIWFYLVWRRQGHFRIGQTQNYERIRRSIYASILQQRGRTLSLSRHTRKSHVPRLTTVNKLKNAFTQQMYRSFGCESMATWKQLECIFSTVL
jgi:hypothetical protein